MFTEKEKIEKIIKLQDEVDELHDKSFQNKIYLITAFIVLFILATAFGALIGKFTQYEDFKEETVMRGFAEYYLDKDFNRQWRWKNEETKEIKN